MNLNCKPGQRAIIVNAHVCPQNIGKIVRVVCECPGNGLSEGATFEIPGCKGEWVKGARTDFFWIVESEGQPLYMSAYKANHTIGTSMVRPWPDAYLRPLPDDDDLLEFDEESNVNKPEYEECQ